ncbi:Insect cuticle protein [Trinorchestia longiramus]|nr:Insect cuticle protein [Trinorchestia longiramus]
MSAAGFEPGSFHSQADSLTSRPSWWYQSTKLVVPVDQAGGSGVRGKGVVLVVNLFAAATAGATGAGGTGTAVAGGTGAASAGGTAAASATGADSAADAAGAADDAGAADAASAAGGAAICCTAWLSRTRSTTAQEILRYEDGTSSRQEHGQPGRKVTGEWSWVDATGQSHRIWYVADEFGFHAYGDTVPKLGPDDQNPSGDSEVPPASVRAQAAESLESEPNTLKNARDLKIINHANARKEFLLDPSNTDSRKEQIDFTPKRTNNSAKQREDRVIPNSALDMMFEGRGESATRTLVKSVMESKNSDGNGFGKMLTGDVSRASQDLFHSELPNPIDGTDFVLINRLQPPTIPKQRAPPTRITPVLVAISRPKNVISGVHTSSRSKSFSAMLPFSLQSAKATRKSIVPQPLKVEGNLNLDNFFSPINEAKATPPPFQIGSLDDYYYYDYDYYDYADFSNNATVNTSSSSPGNRVLSGQGSTRSGLKNSEALSLKSVQTTPSVKKSDDSESTLSIPSSSRLPVPAKVTLRPETKFEEESISTATSAVPPPLDMPEKSSEDSSAEVLPQGNISHLGKVSFPPSFPPPPRIPEAVTGSTRSSRKKSNGDNSGSKEHRSSEDDREDSKESTREKED